MLNLRDKLVEEAAGWHDEEIPKVYSEVIAVAKKLSAKIGGLVTYGDFVDGLAEAGVALPAALRHSALRFAHAIGEIFYVEEENPEVTRAPKFKIVVDVERFSLLVSRIVSSCDKTTLKEQGSAFQLTIRSSSDCIYPWHRGCEP